MLSYKITLAILPNANMPGAAIDIVGIAADSSITHIQLILASCLDMLIVLIGLVMDILRTDRCSCHVGRRVTVVI